MKLKTTQPKARLPTRLHSVRDILLVLLGVALIFSAAGYVAFTKIRTDETAARLWKWAADRGHGSLRSDVSLSQAALRMPQRLLQGIGNADVPKLVIDVKFKHMQKLRKMRDEALAINVLNRAADDFVPGSIRFDNKNIKIRLRLKGDFVEHLEGNKWSFRIEVKGDDHILGMRVFSIQHPKVRGFHSEIMFFETLRHLGVLAPRYRFVDVTINGEPIGLMALEEHFSKELLEANQRRESVIIRFDESLYWAESRDVPVGQRLFSNYRNAPIDSFQTSRIAKSKTLSEDYELAVGLLRGFVEGQLPPSSVFDIDLMGRLLAAAELWGSWHSVRWHNQRFYLNPITAKLEPIGFDASLQGRWPPEKGIGRTDDLVVRLLNDPEVYAAYRKALRQLATEFISGKLPSKIREVETQQMAILRKEFFLLEAFPAGEIEHRAKWMLAHIDENSAQPTASSGKSRNPAVETKKSNTTPAAVSYPTLIHAYVVQGTEPYLELSNAVSRDVEIQAIEWQSKKSGEAVPFHALPAVELPLHLAATPRWTLPKSRHIPYLIRDTKGYELKVTAIIAGQTHTQTVQAKPYFAPLHRHPIPMSTVEQQLSQHPFLRINADDKALSVEAGHWRLTDSLIVPPGGSLTIPAGTTLQFPREAMLISYGPTHFTGAANSKIVLEGVPEVDGGVWQGIAVLGARATSEWSNVVVRNTTSIGRTNWRLLGGVNFYLSEINMHNCRLEGHRGEDAINIIRSRFTLNEIEVADTASDGFDSDFSQGIVRGGIFEHIGKAGGGDGVDLSGSVVTVDGTHFRDISDKALSVGERSAMKARRVFIEQVGTAAASKDGSTLEFADSSVKDVRNVVLMAYIKKPEHGPARIVADNVKIDGLAPEAVAQTGSSIIVNKKAVPAQDVDVESLYATIMKPGMR